MSQSVRIKCANATTLNATITSSSNDFTVGSPVVAKANEVAYVTITYSPDPYSANDAVLHITEANSRQIDVPIIIIDIQNNQPVPPKTPSNPEWATNLPQGLIISKGGLMAPSGKLENSFAPNEAAWISFYNSFVQNAVNLSVAVGERNASKEARIEIIPQSYYDDLRNFMPNLLQQPLLLFTHDGSYLTITNYNSASAKQQMPLDSTKQYSVFVEYNDESGSHKEVNIPVIFTEQTGDTSTGGESGSGAGTGSGSETPTTPTTPTQPTPSEISAWFESVNAPLEMLNFGSVSKADLNSIDPASDDGVQVGTPQTISVTNDKGEARELVLLSAPNVKCTK